MVKLHQDKDSSSSSSEDENDKSEEENQDDANDPSDEDSDEVNDDATEEDSVSPAEVESSNSSSVQTFEGLGVSNWILRQLSCLGISRPSPVQVQCIPPIIKGNL